MDTDIRTVAGIVSGLVVLAMLVLPVQAHKSPTQCEKIKQKISKIESKMRQGYSASAGVKMEEKLRELRKQRKLHCS